MQDKAQILIISGFPTLKSFGGALIDAYAAAAVASGARVDVLDLSSLTFNATPTGRPGPLEPVFEDARARILAARHLVLVYPTWLGAMPARLKGYLEQVIGKDWAFSFAEGAVLPTSHLTGRSADVLVTMDTPPFLYRWLLGAPGHRLIKRAILAPAGVRPVRIFSFGPLGRSTEARRKAWLAKAERRGREIGRKFAS